MKRAVALLLALAFLAPFSVGGITVVSTSAPTLAAIAPPVRLVAVTGTCVLSANVNATGGTLALPYSTGIATPDCFKIIDDGSPQRAYKMRIVGVPNNGRLDDVQIKDGGTTLVKWQNGVVATSESSWMNIGASGATISARIKIDSGAQTNTTVEVLVARSGQTSVYSVYTMTFAFAAG